MTGERWVWVVIGTLLCLILALLWGIIVPGVLYRDMRAERDYYRRASQDCAAAYTAVQVQLSMLIQGDQHHEPTGGAP
jgi:4-amino-4-deoxy-L-arabinose transferase-like glycosyltransferase